MNCEIVYVCNSKNNKNVRANELEILRKIEGKNYFEFGESENNIKKRFYDDMEILEKDFVAIATIKENLKNEEQEIEKEEEAVNQNEEIEKNNTQGNKHNFVKSKSKMNYKKNIF